VTSAWITAGCPDGQSRARPRCRPARSCRPRPGRPAAGRAEGAARRFTNMPMSGSGRDLDAEMIPGVIGRLEKTVIDCPDPRALAEFYCQVLADKRAPGKSGMRKFEPEAARFPISVRASPRRTSVLRDWFSPIGLPDGLGSSVATCLVRGGMPCRIRLPRSVCETGAEGVTRAVLVRGPGRSLCAHLTC
jgi:hypothetical protein